MGSKTRTGKVDRNVFSSEALPIVYFDAINKGESFTLTGFDSERSAKANAELITEGIKGVFSRTYECSSQRGGGDSYNLNCKLIS